MRDGNRGANQVVPRQAVAVGEKRDRDRLIGHMEPGENVPIYGIGVVEKRGSSRLRKWLIGVLVCLCASLLIINSFTYGQFTISRLVRPSNHQDNQIEIHSATDIPTATVPGFVVRTKGCRIPAFEVLDQSIKQYFTETSPFECQAGTHLPLVNSNLTSLFVDPRAKPHFYEKGESPDCCWREFRREIDNDNSITYEKLCQNFGESTEIEKQVEFVKVECRRKGKEIYKDYHAFVPRKPPVEKRCNDSSNADENTSRLSVLILGLDAVSRLNFHRTMPRTVEKLLNLNAVEMLGYNKVADNTFPNMIPVLTGMSEAELSKSCWTGKKKPFDDCSFLWNNFSAAGFRTVLGEDACGMSIFNYLKSGFRNQPTDYYLRPYCLASEKDIGNTHKLNADLCVGTRKTFQNLLDYGKKIAEKFSRDSYFALFWQASLTHDFVTYPKFGDDSYLEFITKTHDDGLLNKTALIMMSDHGIRWGSFRQTYQGHVEESLPFVFILLPEWWRDKYPKSWANLRRNSKSLTTPFDLHETLLHLLNMSETEDQDLRKFADKPSTNSSKIARGLSWFLPIPDHRNCGMAGIPGHWCMCHLSQNTSITDPVVRLAVEFLLNKLNQLVKEYPQCSKLSLKKVLDAKIWSDESQQLDKKRSKDPPSVDYTVTIQTIPGDAIFEATIRHRRKESSQKLVGSISRLNLYGKQSACVDDFKMRLYCYCSR